MPGCVFKHKICTFRKIWICFEESMGAKKSHLNIFILSNQNYKIRQPFSITSTVTRIRIERKWGRELEGIIIAA